MKKESEEIVLGIAYLISVVIFIVLISRFAKEYGI
jgi:hypothetical protein